MTTARKPDATLDVGELLSIDVAAEVRKLSRAQLESPAQLAVELVRRSFAAGATQSHVACSRRSVAVRDDGPGIPAERLDALCSLLDPAAQQVVRHHALLALEATGELALLALAGIDAAGIRVRSGGRALVLQRGARPAVGAAAGSGTTIEIAAAALEAGAVRDALTAAGRFARSQMTLDGAPLAQSGFGEAIHEERIDAPLPGRLALLAAGDTA